MPGSYRLRSQITRLRVELGLYAPLDPQHFSECILRACVDLEAVLPFSSGLWVHATITELRRMRVDGASAVDFAKLTLKGCEP